jgi:hypothetical protein
VIEIECGPRIGGFHQVVSKSRERNGDGHRNVRPPIPNGNSHRNVSTRPMSTGKCHQIDHTKKFYPGSPKQRVVDHRIRAAQVRFASIPLLFTYIFRRNSASLPTRIIVGISMAIVAVVVSILGLTIFMLRAPEMILQRFRHS